MQRRILKQIKALQLGDLIFVEWSDASKGQSLGGPMEIDVPVKTWGIFLAVLGQRNKHLVLAQSAFRFTDGFYDIDYAIIPITWTMAVRIVNSAEVIKEEAQALLTSFLAGRRRTFKRRAENHHGS